MRVDRQRLFQTIHGVAKWGSGRILLNVAEGLEFDVAVERTKRTLSGHSLSGHVMGVSGSAVTLVAHAEMMMGTIWTPGAAYEVVPFKDGVHVFREVDMSARLPLGEPVRGEDVWARAPSTWQADAHDGGNVVDALVLWTPRAQENAGGEAEMRVLVEFMVGWANDAWERSGAHVRLKLVGAEPVDYVEYESGSGEFFCGIDLDRLRNPSDGFMDGAHGRREALGADLVSLITGDGDVAGLARVPGSFSLVVRFQGGSSYGIGSTFAHELGHNMGLSHDRYQVFGRPSVRGLLPFSYGYVNRLAFEPGAAEDDCWLTIMSYPNRCSDSGLAAHTVPYFSTPDLHHPDDPAAPLGVPKSNDEEGPDGPADAVYALNLRTPQVAGFRSGRTDDGETPQTATPVVATSTTFARLAASDDIDYFRIELPEAGGVRVGTRITGSGNLRGTLTTEDGELIAEDDDSGEGYNFLIEAELQAGVYFIRVEESQQWQTPHDYALVVSFNPASAADDHGDGEADATLATLRSSTAGELQNPSDTDWFRFEVAERGVVRVGTAGETDTVGALTSEGGAIRITNDDGGPGVNFLIAAKLDPGTYFVSVSSFDSNPTGPYSLDIAFSSLSAEPDDHADSPAGATDIAVGTPVAGELELSLDHDYFRIEVPGTGPGQLWVESTGDTDVKGALFGQDSELIGEEDFFGEHPNFVVGALVAPGTYFFRVKGASTSDLGPYGLEVSFTANGRAIPLFLSSDPNRHGFARIINRDNRPGQVAIHAIDDAGERHGPITLSLAARQTSHFNSEDLEMGNAAKHLSDGVGSGEGDWRLELVTDLDIEALAYVRTGDGFLTGMNEVVTSYRTLSVEEEISIFNPASNRSQVSKLRFINTGPGQIYVYLYGYDDQGEFDSRRNVHWWLRPSATRTFTAQSLEAGGSSEDRSWQGSLGDGEGKWRLRMSPSSPTRAMSLLESPTGHLANLTGRAPLIGRNVSVPLFISASSPTQQGFIRIINRAEWSGEVAVHAIDDAGRRSGPVTFSLDAGHVAHFNSDDLEMGDRGKGLSGSFGAGTGDWRLEFTADMDIEALAYVRTSDGFLTGMNAVVPQHNGRHEVVFFNPASNDRQVSTLRLVNPTAAPAAISISGLDDAGAVPPAGDITLTLPAGTATAITAQQLEAGAAHFDGRFGDGAGKWQLFIEADQDIQAMSLLESPTGHISNLSAGTAVR